MRNLKLALTLSLISLLSAPVIAQPIGTGDTAAATTSEAPVAPAPAAATPVAEAPVAPVAPVVETVKVETPVVETVKVETVKVETQAWWQVLVAEITKVAVAIFTPVLGMLAFVLMRRWGLKIDLEKANSIASWATGYGEQKALNALKEGKEKTSGADKMKMALDFANGMANQYRLPKRASESLEKLIEANLGGKKVVEAPKVEG